GRDFFGGKGSVVAAVEVVADKTIECLPVLLAIVVARIEVDMRSQLVRCAVESVEGAGRPYQGGVGVVSAEAAVVIRVVADHSGSWSTHGREGCVIRDARQVHRSLLTIAEILVGELRAGNEAGISRNRSRNGDAKVERTDEDGLPATAGKSGHRDPRRVGVRMRQKNVESVFLRQIVQGNTVGPQQIQLVGSLVVEAVQL